MRTGVVGYETGGQHFQAPFILAAGGYALAGVVARAPGTVAKVRADLPEGRADTGFVITLRHESCLHRHVSASKLNSPDVRELRAYGGAGSHSSHRTDVQAIFAGLRSAARGTQPPVTANEGNRTLAVLDAARQGAHEGRFITPQER